jgi:hypothetical protein
MGVALGACSRQGFLGIASAIAGSSARKSNGNTPLRIAEKTAIQKSLNCCGAARQSELGCVKLRDKKKLMSGE